MVIGVEGGVSGTHAVHRPANPVSPTNPVPQGSRGVVAGVLDHGDQKVLLGSGKLTFLTRSLNHDRLHDCQLDDRRGDVVRGPVVENVDVALSMHPHGDRLLALTGVEVFLELVLVRERDVGPGSSRIGDPRRSGPARLRAIWSVRGLDCR